MDRKSILIRDLIVSVLLLGGAIAATVITHFGAFETLYFVPYVLYELDNAFFVRKIIFPKEEPDSDNE